MSKIELYTIAAKLKAENDVDYPNDVVAIKEEFPILKCLSNGEVALLWRTFSTDEYYAGWLGLDEGTFDSFNSFLEELVES